ncbi:iron-containing alcohol dehydrogenase [Histomonas meleagridis]|uniref:iron-containing alcohol dehydrogenase n=1 Tax=Histomonas meleagridis TaxID=135588 RepID=UPI0035599FBA|nr:iron-containing alcohol dehydrogenase [Histomonas meleagridis]KAH0799370.1 iron-containing alcohol dehydrogenase [Histomonas meleagridis]
MSSLVPYHWMNDTHIAFGVGAIETVKEYVKKGTKILCIADNQKHIYKSGAKSDVDRVLSEIGAKYTWSEKIEANPDYSTICELISDIRKNPVDLLLTVGGGSAMDATKFISSAVNLPSSVEPWSILRHPELIGKTIPMISVCTLAATGSEWNERFVISRRSTGEKVAGANPHNFFKTCNGLFDSYCHVMEEYITGHFAPMQDRMSEGVAKTIIELAPKLLEHPSDLNFRATAMQTSSMALNTLLQTGTISCWGTHRSSMILTAKYGMDHGQSLVPILANVWKRFFDVKKFKLAQMADRVWEYKGYGTVDDKAKYSIDKMQEFARMLKLKLTISEYTHEAHPEQAVKDMVEYTWDMMGRKPFGERGIIKSKEDLEVIYSNSF